MVSTLSTDITGDREDKGRLASAKKSLIGPGCEGEPCAPLKMGADAAYHLLDEQQLRSVVLVLKFDELADLVGCQDLSRYVR